MILCIASEEQIKHGEDLEPMAGQTELGRNSTSYPRRISGKQVNKQTYMCQVGNKPGALMVQRDRCEMFGIGKFIETEGRLEHARAGEEQGVGSDFLILWGFFGEVSLARGGGGNGNVLKLGSGNNCKIL